MISAFIERVQRLLKLPTVEDRIHGLQIKYEEPLLVDGPSEVAFVMERIPWLLGLGALLLVALAINIGWLNVAAFAIVAIVIVLLMISAVNDHYKRYIITTDRIIQISGVVSVKNTWIPYSKVTDLTFEQGLSDRILGVAKVRIDSANVDSPFHTLTNLTNPQLFSFTLSTMVNLRQVPNRLGTVSNDPKRLGKRLQILMDLLDQIEEAGLSAWRSRSKVVEAVFDDWVFDEHGQMLVEGGWYDYAFAEEEADDD